MADPDAQRSDTIEFRQSKKHIAFSLVFMLLVIVFYALTLGTDPTISDPIFEFGPITIPNWAVAIPSIAFFSLIVLLWIRKSVDQRPHLVLDEAGLHGQGLPIPIPWSNVEGVSQASIRGLIDLHLHDPEEYLGRLSPMRQRMARRNYRRKGVAVQIAASSMLGGSSEEVMAAIRARIPRIDGERTGTDDAESAIATRVLESRKLKVLARFATAYGVLGLVAGVFFLIGTLVALLENPAPIALFGLALSAFGVGFGLYLLKSGREAVREPSPAHESRLRYTVAIVSGSLLGTTLEAFQETFPSEILWPAVLLFSFLLERQIRRWMKPTLPVS